jgi:hypothetical protein
MGIRLLGELSTCEEQTGMMTMSFRDVCDVDERIDKQLVFTMAQVSEELRATLEGPIPLATPDEAALSTWLSYLGLLVLRSADAILCLFIHKASIFARMLMRQPAECVAKALYFDLYPKFAEREWLRGHKTHLAILKEQGRTKSEEYRKIAAELDNARKKFYNFDRSEISVKTMIDELSQSRTAYPFHYRFPSLWLHADPAGSGALFEIASDGTRTVVSELDLNEIQASLIDVAFYMISVGETCNRRFARGRDDKWAACSRAVEAHAARLKIAI